MTQLAQRFVALILAVLLLPPAQCQCFSNMRFPKFVQTSSNEQENSADAVVAHEGLQAIFSAGSLTQTAWQINAKRTAQVGRIDVASRSWDWQVHLREPGDALHSVTALAVDPAGTKLACYGYASPLDTNDAQQGFLFVLDASSGAGVSGLMKLTHDDAYRVTTAGFLLNDAGTAFMAFNHLGGSQPSGEQMLRVGAWDSSTNTLTYMKQAAGYNGVSGSLVWGTGALSSQLFVGGSHFSNSAYNLAIVRYTAADTSASSISRIYYDSTNGSCSLNKLGYTDSSKSAWISHLGFEEISGSSFLFGATISHDHWGNAGERTFVFKVLLDANGDALDSDLDLKEIDKGNYHAKSRFLGMRQTMEFDGSDYWLHLIYHRDADKVYYLRVSPTSTNDAIGQQLNNDKTYGTSAVFFGSGSGTIGSSNTITAYEAFYVGRVKKVLSDQTNSWDDFKQFSYVVMSTIEDSNNCHRSALAEQTIQISTPSCNGVLNESHSFADFTSTTTDSTLQLSLQMLDTTQQKTATECDASHTSISATSAGFNSFPTMCFNYGALSSAAFTPPSVDNPSTCSDANWQYRVGLSGSSPTSPLPSNFQFMVDKDASSLTWGTVDTQDIGYDAAHSYGTFQFEVTAVLPTNPYTEQLAATIDIEFDCCAAPTVISTPTTSAASYDYFIGDSTLTVALSGLWTGDNACCSLTASTPVVDPAAPIGLFTVDASTNLSVDVYSTDVSVTGPGGLSYTVTTSPSGSTCTSSSSSVAYTVNIVNKCEVASFTIDAANAKLQSVGTPSLTYTLGDATAQTVVLDHATSDIQSTITWTDPCGAILMELYDVRGGSEAALDALIMTESLSSSQITLTVSGSDFATIGTYNLRLKVYYTDFPASASTRDFDVEVLGPCNTAILTIDDSVFQVAPAVSLTQFVSNAETTLQWTDAIVTSSVTESPDPCGALTFAVDDITSGSPLALDSTVFPTFDVASATKTIGVATSDLTKAALYNLQLSVYYTSYSTNVHTKAFDVSVVDYCAPTSITTQPFVPTSLSYTLGDSTLTSNFALWTTTPDPCTISFVLTVTPALEDPNLIVFDEATRTVTVQGSDVFYGGDHLTGTYTPGSYTAEIRAFSDGASPVDTGSFVTLLVTVLDPCDVTNGSGVITILPAIVSPNPIVYQIYDAADVQTLAQTDGVTTSESVTSVQCPAISFEVTDSLGSSTLDSLFTWDSASQTLTTESSDQAKLSTPSYTLVVKAFYQGGAQHTYPEGGSLNLVVNLADPCVTPSSLTDPGQTDPADYYFTGPAPTLTFTATAFAVVPADCTVTYACLSNTGPRTDLCTVNQNGGLTVSTFDTASGDFTFQTTQLDLANSGSGFSPGVYTVTLEATSGTVSTQTSFTVTFVDPCATLATLTLAATPVFSGSYEHRLRDAVVSYAWDPATVATLSGVQVDCGSMDASFFVADGAETALDSVVFTDSRAPSTEFQINYFEDTSKPGTYLVSYKVFLVDYPTVEVHLASAFTVDVFDPCLSPILTVTASTLADQQIYVSDSALVYTVPAYTVYGSWCDLTYTFAASDNAVLPAIVFDAATHIFTFEYSLDLTLSGPTSTDYTITVTGTSGSVTDAATFVLTLSSPCDQLTLNTIFTPTTPYPSKIIYRVGQSKETVLLQTFTSPDGGATKGFRPSQSMCGDISLSVDFYYFANSNAPDGPYPLADTSVDLTFQDEDTLEIYSEDISLIGMHAIHISASLDGYPSVVSAAETVIDVEFGRCALSILAWDLYDVTVPPVSSQQETFIEPVLQYNGVSCGYSWESFSFEVSESSDQSIQDFSLFVKLDPDTLTFTYLQQNSLTEDTELTITAWAHLSDLVTVATQIFKVTFQAPAPILEIILQPTNKAPYFLVEVARDYVRTKLQPQTDQEGASNPEIQPVNLGEVFDEEGDHVSQEFKCLTCSEEEHSLFAYEEASGTIFISSKAGLATHYFKLKLLDDNANPEQTIYNFQVTIAEMIVVEFETEKAEEEKKFKGVVIGGDQDGDEEIQIPTFSIRELSFIGQMKLAFSQDLVKLSDISQINQDVLSIKLEPHESNFIEDESVLDFTWETTSFTARSMTLQINFAKPSYVSSGQQRDMVHVTIKEPKYFFSAENYLAIPKGTSDSVKAPLMMANNDFTKAFLGTAETFGGFTNASLVGNFIVNLLLSGAMNLLWGLLHALQIVAHFPLINLMMPGNAAKLFQIMVKVATFDIVPTEEFIASSEETIGLEYKEFELTDNFVNYGFYSSDVIRNLQVMFIFMVFLLLFPLFVLLLRALCFWSERCTRCRTRMTRTLFFNTYIRFGLEAFLELAISGMLRIRQLEFDTASAKFHSIFSLALLAFLAAFVVFVGVFPQLRFGQLDTPQFKQRYSDLVLALKKHNRVALASPLLFVARRLIYAGLVVFWVHRSYFQIQLMIFKCSFFMLFSGYFSPLDTPFACTMDLINEVLTLVCSYSLIMFSAFVPDAEMRYLCGWWLILMVLLMLSINLAVILTQAIKQLVRSCRLKWNRRQNRKRYKAVQKRLQREIKNRELAQQRIKADQFYNINAFDDFNTGEEPESQPSSIQLKMKLQPAIATPLQLKSQVNKLYSDLESIKEEIEISEESKQGVSEQRGVEVSEESKEGLNQDVNLLSISSYQSSIVIDDPLLSQPTLAKTDLRHFYENTKSLSQPF